MTSAMHSNDFNERFYHRLYTFLHLNPHRSVVIHLCLIGVAWIRIFWRQSNVCEYLWVNNIHSNCDPNEDFVVHQIGLRLIDLFILKVIVGIFLIWKSLDCRSFHKLLGTSSALILLSVWYAQEYHQSAPKTPMFSIDFYRTIWASHGLAALLSLWTVAVAPPKKRIPSMKWSIPANSIFWGGVSRTFACCMHICDCI